jgi:hypothetical protein
LAAALPPVMPIAKLFQNQPVLKQAGFFEKNLPLMRGTAWNAHSIKLTIWLAWMAVSFRIAVI